MSERSCRPTNAFPAERLYDQSNGFIALYTMYNVHTGARTHIMLHTYLRTILYLM